MVDATIIVPAHNSEKTISKTIESLQNQKTKKKFEVIIVDDKSTDNTKKIATAYKEIQYIFQEKGGPAKARNLGAKKAKGKILVFIDSDCEAEPNWLEEMLKPFEYPNVAGVQGAYKTKQKELPAIFTQIEIEDRYDLMKTHPKIDWIGSYSAAYLKRAFMQAKGFDENFPTASGEDPELSFRISKLGYRLEFNQNAIVYHNHPKTFAEYFKKKFFRAYYRVLLYKKHPKKAIKDTYTPQIMKIRIALIGLLILAIIAGTQKNTLNFIALIITTLILLSTAPFTAKAFEKNKKAGAIAPIILIARDTMFLAGLALGAIRFAVKK
jgi:glycosyltransferase involved in cell wall biosynthesis